MKQLEGVFHNGVLGTLLLSWFVAQVLKMIIHTVRTKKFDLTRMVGSGGMPSSHAALVMSLATAIGMTEGFDTPLFALSTAFALVVMYDASGVRRAAGKQARVLNRMVAQIMEEHHLPQYETLKEFIGHTPVEVLVGAVLGIVIAVLRH